MGQRQTIPVLPLRGTVIFPGLTAPIAAGRPGTLRAIESALKGDRLVFAVAQRDNTDEPTPDILYSRLWLSTQLAMPGSLRQNFRDNR